MRGKGKTLNDKWMHINQLVKEKRIGVLALQETYLSEPNVENIRKLFGKRLHIHYSAPPLTRATSMQGVTIILNRDVTNIEGIREYEIIPG